MDSQRESYGTLFLIYFAKGPNSSGKLVGPREKRTLETRLFRRIERGWNWRGENNVVDDIIRLKKIDNVTEEALT